MSPNLDPTQSNPYFINLDTKMNTNVAGVTRAIFSDIVMENFTALSLDDREVELKPGGKNIPVTWDNRLE